MLMQKMAGGGPTPVHGPEEWADDLCQLINRPAEVGGCPAFYSEQVECGP